MGPNSQDSLLHAQHFIEDFIDADFNLWAANYTFRDEQQLEGLITRFTQQFFSFPVTVVIGRPTSPEEAWFTGPAREDLAVTFRRPLFKIERLNVSGQEVYAAYTGSTDEGSSAYYEVLIFRAEPEGFRIFSVYHPDFEGGLEHVQGERIDLTGDLTEVLRLQAPDDDLDLQDYRREPESRH